MDVAQCLDNICNLKQIWWHFASFDFFVNIYKDDLFSLYNIRVGLEVSINAW